MKRAPLVLTGTACGLVAVIGYHTQAPQAVASTGASSGAGSLSIGGASASGTSTTSGTSTAATAAASTTPAATASAATASAATTRSATGTDVQYQFGDVEVKVTMTAGKITDVTVVKADAYDPHSQQIDVYALPALRSQALRTQSAKLDGVSGASYTSAAYEQSLQSALDKLKA